MAAMGAEGEVELVVGVVGEGEAERDAAISTDKRQVVVVGVVDVLGANCRGEG